MQAFDQLHAGAIRQAEVDQGEWRGGFDKVRCLGQAGGMRDGNAGESQMKGAGEPVASGGEVVDDEGAGVGVHGALLPLSWVAGIGMESSTLVPPSVPGVQ